jgi:hypothetical protein
MLLLFIIGFIFFLIPVIILLIIRLKSKSSHSPSPIQTSPSTCGSPDCKFGSKCNESGNCECPNTCSQNPEKQSCNSNACCPCNSPNRCVGNVCIPPLCGTQECTMTGKDMGDHPTSINGLQACCCPDDSPYLLRYGGSTGNCSYYCINNSEYQTNYENNYKQYAICGQTGPAQPCTTPNCITEQCKARCNPIPPSGTQCGNTYCNTSQTCNVNQCVDVTCGSQVCTMTGMDMSNHPNINVPQACCCPEDSPYLLRYDSPGGSTGQCAYYCINNSEYQEHYDTYYKQYATCGHTGSTKPCINPICELEECHNICYHPPIEQERCGNTYCDITQNCDNNSCIDIQCYTSAPTQTGQDMYNNDDNVLMCCNQSSKPYKVNISDSDTADKIDCRFFCLDPENLSTDNEVRIKSCSSDKFTISPTNPCVNPICS